MTDIFSVHQLIASEVNHLCSTKEDVLHGLVHDLGSAETNKSEMIGVSSAEINLTLNPKLHDVEGKFTFSVINPLLTFILIT